MEAYQPFQKTTVACIYEYKYTKIDDHVVHDIDMLRLCKIKDLLFQ